MPIVVNPSFQWPPEVEPVSSPDGRLTAIVDPAHAGVLLRADFDDSVPDTPAVPERVLRRNLAVNGSFETGTDGWAASNGTLTAHDGFQARMWPPFGYGPGSKMLQASSGNASEYMTIYCPSTSPMNTSVQPGQWYAFAALIAGEQGSGSGTGIRSEITFYGSQTSYAQPLPRGTASFYSGRRDIASAQVPASATSASPRITLHSGTSGTNLPSGRRVWVDGVIVAVGETQTEAEAAVATYFDGSTPAAGNRRYRYASDGTSEEYIPATPFIPGKPGTVAKVRFERQDGSVVRSGNPAWAPGGWAHAYDHEATLGGGTMWRAVPIRYDGTEGTPSDYVTVVIPGLSDGWAWLKPVTDPDKAMLLKVEPPDLDYNGRLDTTSIAGSPHPAATWDVLEGFTTQLRSLVRDKLVADQLMALLDEGPVLAQFPKCAGLPDFYFLRGKLSLEHVHWDGYPWRRYQWDVVRVHRPDTTDTPLRIPGLSYDTVARDWTTYDQLKSTVTSYNTLLEP